MEMAEHSPYIMSEFKRVTTIFDRLRNESIADLVPQLRPVMEAKIKIGDLGSWLNMAISRIRWLSGKIRKRLLA